MQVHFIAVGGGVMHQFALVPLKIGYAITASDDGRFEPDISNVENTGQEVSNAWNPDRIHKDPYAVMVSMDTQTDNPRPMPELKLNSSPENICHKNLNKQRLLVNGSHGKMSKSHFLFPHATIITSSMDAKKLEDWTAHFHTLTPIFC